jgi:hypothetical protein
MMTVKDLLKQDLPPTNATAKMRKDHTIGGVTHNLKHDYDHMKDTVTSLKKLYTVDSKAANQQANRVLKQYTGDINQIKALVKGWN